MSKSNNTIKISQNDVNYTKLHQNNVSENNLDASGLSTYHIRRKKGEITLFTDGSLLEVSKNRTSKTDNKGGGRGGVTWKRGKIKGFSKSARRRMMRMMAKVNKNDVPQFLTLTYPKEYSSNPEDWKYHLDKFKRRMKYRYPEFSGIWKLEFQKRGAPHFHLLVWGLPKYGMKEIISNQWYESVNSGDKKHLLAGTEIKKIRSWRGVMSYVSKYMGKVIEFEEIEAGRFWGAFNRDFIPWSKIEKYEVFQNQIIMAMRYMRRYAGIKSRDYSSLSIYINDPDQWKRALLC